MQHQSAIYLFQRMSHHSLINMINSNGLITQQQNVAASFFNLSTLQLQKNMALPWSMLIFWFYSDNLFDPISYWRKKLRNSWPHPITILIRSTSTSCGRTSTGIKKKGLICGGSFPMEYNYCGDGICPRLDIFLEHPENMVLSVGLGTQVDMELIKLLV